MTLVAIMKDDENPRLQIAAAKALLSRDVSETVPEPLEHDLSPDDIDAAGSSANSEMEFCRRAQAFRPRAAAAGRGGIMEHAGDNRGCQCLN